MKGDSEIHWPSGTKPRILGLIPARYASTRFPGKPLIDIHGKSMIQRVYERASGASLLDHVAVATDDPRIKEHVEAFGGNVVMTANTHQSGTDRCAEAASKLNSFDIVINIQGDEPYINSTQIDLLASCFKEANTELATLVKRINTEDELSNTNSPKVIMNAKGEAIYFSRTPIPFLRGVDAGNWLDKHVFYKHIGIYGYRMDILKEITVLDVSTLEKAESLEQLRWIENGYKIKVAVTDLETQAIDTPEDLRQVLNSKESSDSNI